MSPLFLKLFKAHSKNGEKATWTLFLGVSAVRRYQFYVLGLLELRLIRVPSSASFWKRLSFLTVGAKWAKTGKLDHLPRRRALRSNCRASGGRLPGARPESDYWLLVVWRGLATVQLQIGLFLQQIWRVGRDCQQTMLQPANQLATGAVSNCCSSERSQE